MVRRMKRLCLLLFVVACGTKSNPPTNPNLDRGSDVKPLDPSSMPSGTSVNLTCNAVGNDKCKAQSYTFAGDYSQPSSCTWSPASNELVFQMKGGASNPTDNLFLQIKNFHGADTYRLGTDDRVQLGATVTMAATTCSTAHTGGEPATSPKASCSGCTVTVSDPNPNAPFPKDLTAHIACPNLCNEDAYTCGGINVTVTQQCSH